MENLEEKVKKFFNSHTLNQITIEEVKKTFPNLNEKTDEDYSILHAIADINFPVEKAIKTISYLLELGANPNDQDIYGNYTFIHLAFYSNYPLSFFEKVIPLALKYNFNINSKDEDGDTIIHSAIYSEDYLDKIFPLFALLDNTFDLEIKNNAGKNILEALAESLKEAKKTNNKAWYKQLTEEEGKIYVYLKEKYKWLEENREKIKEEERKAKEEKEYQQFLINLKNQLETCSTLQDVNNLLNITPKIKDLEYKKEVEEKLTTTKNNWNNLITTSKEKKAIFDKLLSFYPTSTTLIALQEKLKKQTVFEELPIQTVIDLTTSINDTVEKELNLIVEETATKINNLLLPLEEIKPLTSRNLLGEVKQLVKTTKEKKTK